MIKFYKDLQKLNEIYNSNKFELVALYGDYGVGKTALLKEFLKDKGKCCVYYCGVDSTAKHNKNVWTSAVCIRNFQGGINSVDEFDLDFMLALQCDCYRGRKIAFVFDDIHKSCKSVENFLDILHGIVETYREKSDITIILCDNTVEFIKNGIFQKFSFTEKIELTPFDFKDVCEYFTNFSDDEKAYLYGSFGGKMRYLSLVDKNLSYKENLNSTFCNPSSMIFEEPENILLREIREPFLYDAILTEIASGNNRMSVISKNIGESTNTCSIYLKKLIELGFVKKELPYGESDSKRAIYSICDNMLRFYYCNTFKYKSIIAVENNCIYDFITSKYNNYMQGIFKDICMQYLEVQLGQGKCPVKFASLGSWWHSSSKNGEINIDIVGATEDKIHALLADCIWSEEKANVNSLNSLIEHSTSLSYLNKQYYLFSKSGFTDECIREAKTKNVTLIGYPDIIKEFEVI